MAEQQIRERVMQKLGQCGELSDRIDVDDSAIEQLQIVSQGDLSIAESYAGLAILAALGEQRVTVTADDVEKVNFVELAALMSTGRDPWDQVAYIGTKVPNLTAQGIKLRRLTQRSDAALDIDARAAASEGRLPAYVMLDQIVYTAEGPFAPSVEIPFKIEPSQAQVEAIAHGLAKFVIHYTQEAQEVRDISGAQGIQYFVQEQRVPGQDPMLARPNYRLVKGFTFIEGAQGSVTINRETLCRHPQNTLEAYVQSLKPSEQTPSKS